MCARSVKAEYEGELGTKVENGRQRQHGDPRGVLHTADISKDLHPEQEPEVPHAKEEEEPKTPDIKDEEEEADITKFPFTVIVKTEDDRDGVDDEEGKECGGPQAASLLAPLSDSDDITSHSSNTDEEEDSEGDITCHADNKHVKCSHSHCDKTFGKKSSLDRYMRTGKKAFACSVCNISFNERSEFVIHMKSHTGEKQFECSICGNRFSLKGHFIAHARIHTREKPFACSVCGKKFTEKGQLGTHARTHTGEKPFACSICSKRFTQKGHLETHTRTHTGEKPFACSVCTLTFSDGSVLVRHMRTHTGEKHFSCSVCGKRFTQRSYLTTHTRTHTGEKPFSCNVCDKRFHVKLQLTRHKCAGEKSSMKL